MEEEVSWQKLMGIDDFKDDHSLSPVFHKNQWILLRKSEKENTSVNVQLENNGISSAFSQSQHLNCPRSSLKKNERDVLCENSKIQEEEIVYHSPIKTRSMKRKIHDHPLSGSISPRSPLRKRSRIKHRTKSKNIPKQDLYLSSVTNVLESNSSLQIPGNIISCKAAQPLSQTKRKLIYSTNKLKPQNPNCNIDINDLYKSVIMMEEADKVISSKVSKTVTLPDVSKEFVTFSTLLNYEDNVHNDIKISENSIVNCQQSEDKTSFDLNNDIPVKKSILNDTLNNFQFTELEEYYINPKSNGNVPNKPIDLIPPKVTNDFKVEGIRHDKNDNEFDQVQNSSPESTKKLLTTEVHQSNCGSSVEKVSSTHTPIRENAFNDSLNNFQFTEIENKYCSYKPNKHVGDDTPELNLSSPKGMEDLIVNNFEKSEQINDSFPINTSPEINCNTTIKSPEELVSKPKCKTVFDRSTEDLVRFNEIFTPTDMFLSEFPVISTPSRQDACHSKSPNSMHDKTIMRKMSSDQNSKDNLFKNTNGTAIKDDVMSDGIKLKPFECHKRFTSFEDDFNTVKILNLKCLNEIKCTESESTELTESTDGSKTKVEALLQGILDKPSDIPIQRLLSEEFLDSNSTVVQFSTARGSVVKTSQESLDKAKELLHEIMFGEENLENEVGTPNDSPRSLKTDAENCGDTEALLHNDIMKNQDTENESVNQILKIDHTITLEEGEENKQAEEDPVTNPKDDCYKLFKQVTSEIGVTLENENFIVKEGSIKFGLESNSRIFPGDIGPLNILPKLELNSLTSTACDTPHELSPCNQKDIFIENHEVKIFPDIKGRESFNLTTVKLEDDLSVVSMKHEKLMIETPSKCIEEDSERSGMGNPEKKSVSKFHFFTAGGSIIPVSEESLYVVRKSSKNADYEGTKDNFSPLKLTYEKLLNKTSSNSPASSARLSQETISEHSSSQESILPLSKLSLEDIESSADSFNSIESKKESDGLCLNASYMNDNKTPLRTPFKSWRLSTSKRLLSLSTRSKRQNLLGSENTTPKNFSRKTKHSEEKSTFQQELKKAKYEAEAERILKSPEYDLNNRIVSCTNKENDESSLQNDKSQSKEVKPKQIKRKDLLFNTAKGDKVNITRQSLRSARNLLKTELEPIIYEKEADFIIKSPEYDLKNNKPSSFTTAKGKNVIISERSIEKVKLLFKDDFDNVTKSEDLTSLEDKLVLTTATGQGVNISKESLENVRRIFKDEIDPSTNEAVSMSKLFNSSANDSEKNSCQIKYENVSPKEVQKANFSSSPNKFNETITAEQTNSEYYAKGSVDLKLTETESDMNMNKSLIVTNYCSKKLKSPLRKDNVFTNSEFVQSSLNVQVIDAINKKENYILTGIENIPVDFKCQSPEDLVQKEKTLGTPENAMKNHNSDLLKALEETKKEKAILFRNEQVKTQLLSNSKAKINYNDKENCSIVSELIERNLELNESENVNINNKYLESNFSQTSSAMKANNIVDAACMIKDQQCEEEQNLNKIGIKIVEKKLDENNSPECHLKLDITEEKNENEDMIESHLDRKETKSQVVDKNEMSLLNDRSKLILEAEPFEHKNSSELITKTNTKLHPASMFSAPININDDISAKLFSDDINVTNSSKDNTSLLGVKKIAASDFTTLDKSCEFQSGKESSIKHSDFDAKTAVSMFSTANGNKVNISEKTLQKVRNIFKDDFYDAPCCSNNSAEYLEVKEGYESKIGNLKESVENQNEYTVKPSESDPLTAPVPMFSTAKGHKVNISEKTLQKVKNIFKDDFNVAPCCSKSSIPYLEVKEGYESKIENPKESVKNQNEYTVKPSESDPITAPVPMFSTAKGHTVNISEKTLEKVKNIFKDDFDAPPCSSSGSTPYLKVKKSYESKIETPKESANNQNNFECTIKSLDCDPITAPAPMFSTANGNRVIISEKSLQKVRNIFKDDFDLAPGCSKGKSPYLELKENNRAQVELPKESDNCHVITSALVPKSSPSEGNNLIIPEKRLQKTNDVFMNDFGDIQICSKEFAPNTKYNECKKKTATAINSTKLINPSVSSMPKENDENLGKNPPGSSLINVLKSHGQVCAGATVDSLETPVNLLPISEVPVQETNFDKIQNSFAESTKIQNNDHEATSKISMQGLQVHKNEEMRSLKTSLEVQNISSKAKCNTKFSSARKIKVIMSENILEKVKKIFKDDFDAIIEEDHEESELKLFDENKETTPVSSASKLYQETDKYKNDAGCNIKNPKNSNNELHVKEIDKKKSFCVLENQMGIEKIVLAENKNNSDCIDKFPDLNNKEQLPILFPLVEDRVLTAEEQSKKVQNLLQDKLVTSINANISENVPKVEKNYNFQSSAELRLENSSINEPTTTNNVTVSEKSLENILKEDINPGSFIENEERSESFNTLVQKDHEMIYSSEISPKVENIQSDIFKDDKECIIKSSEFGLKNQCPMFLTAGGNSVFISEKNLLNAKNIFKDELEASFQFIIPETLSSLKQHKFSSSLSSPTNIIENKVLSESSIKSVQGEKFNSLPFMLLTAKESVGPVTPDGSEKVRNISNDDSNNYQSGQELLLKENNSFKKSGNISDINEDALNSNNFSHIMCTTAGESKMKLSEESLNKVKTMSKEDVDTYGEIHLGKVSELCTPVDNDSSKVIPKELNIPVPHKKFTEVVSNVTDKNKSLLFFPTVGSKENTTEECLSSVKNMLKEDLKTCRELPLSEAQKSMSVANRSSNVLIAEEKHTINMSNKKINEIVTDASEKNMSVIFSTASGSNVGVSEDSLRKVRIMFKDDLEVGDNIAPHRETTHIDSSLSNNSSYFKTTSQYKQGVHRSDENKLKMNENRDTCEVKTKISVIFSTASGSTVGVSEDSLRRVRNMFKDDLEINDNFTSEREAVNVASCFSDDSSHFKATSQHEQEENKLNENVLKINRNLGTPEVKTTIFSNSSESSVGVSEESLLKMRNIFKDGIEPCGDLVAGDETKNPKSFNSSAISNVTTRQVNNENRKFNGNIIMNTDVKNKISAIFSTASGNYVSVSEDSLHKVKNLFKDDLETHGNLIKEEAQKHESCVSKNDSSSGLQNNREASSGDLTNNTENLCTSKRLNNLCQIFSTAGGSTVTISEESLRQVQNKFKDELQGGTPKTKIDIEKSEFLSQSDISKESSDIKTNECSDILFKPNNVSHNVTNKQKKSICFPTVQENELCAAEDSLEKTKVQCQNNIEVECFPNHDSLIFPVTPKTNKPLNSQNIDNYINQEHLSFTPTLTEHLLNDELNKIENRICPKNNSDPDSSEKVSVPKESVTSETPLSYKMRSTTSSHVSQRRLVYKSQEAAEDVGKPYITSPSLCCDRSQIRPLKSCGIDFDSDDDIFAAAETQIDVNMVDSDCNDSLKLENMDLTGGKRMSDSSSANEPVNKKAKLLDEFHTINMDEILIERERKREEMRQKINLKIKNPPPVSQGLYKTIRDKETLKKFMEDPLNNPNTYSYDELLEMGLYADVINVTSKNAVEFQFDGHYFFKEECFSKTGFIDLGSGFILILSDSNKVGLKEISDSFLASPNVDPSLIPEGWIKNHYRWIVWKLASLEKSFPQALSRRYLVPLNVLHQLKYRYDREIDLVQRPALKRILECDEPASRRFIVRVADLRKLESDELDPSFELELTDGWYGVWSTVDSAMMNLIKKGTVKVGTKLIIQGAELLNCGDGCDPLEIKESVRLKLSTNSVRRVKWHARMGFTQCPGPLHIGLASVLPDGGTVGVTSAIVARVYPILYMSKDANGKSVVRNAQAENQIAADFEKERNLKSEKLFEQILAEVENKFKKGPKSKIDTKNLKWIMNPPALYRIISQEPEIHASLSPEQLEIVKKYHEEITSKIQAEVQAALQVKLKDLAPPRQVTSLLKIRIVDPLTECSAMVTIWRPTEELCSLLTENRCIDFHGLNASGMRNNVLQLTSSKITYYKESRRFPKSIKFQRKLTDFSQLINQNSSMLFNELDVVGVVVYVKEPEKPGGVTNVYLSDLKDNFLMVTFWTSLKAFGFRELLKEGTIVAGINLHWRQGLGSYVVPSVFANELTCFSSHSTQDYISKELAEFKAYFSEMDVSSFVGARKATLFSLLKERSCNMTPVRRVDSIGVSPQIAKRLEKLKSYGPAPPLPKTPLLSSPDIRKSFKPPKINKASLDSPRV